MGNCGFAMSDIVRQIGGDEWEKEMLALLGKRYSPGDFFEVPADDKGDLGMDAVGRDGVVYQFYAPQEPLSNKELKKKQKKKIYDDLKKLVDKQAEHKRVLGNITVSRWMLLVPRLKSKDVQAYANEKAEMVRATNCSYIAGDFEAVVNTDAILAVERNQLVNGVLTKLKINIPEPSLKQVDGWIKSEKGNELLDMLKCKLRKIPTLDSEQNLKEAANRYIKAFLRGQDLLSKLQREHPRMWENVKSTKRAFEHILVIRSDTSAEKADRRLLVELKEYESKLTSNIQSELGGENISQLVLEAVADWLMRCPLDFKEK